MHRIEFPQRKHIRAGVIKEYMDAAGWRGCVCISCGNASRALRNVGADTIDISPGGVFVPTGWLLPEQVHRLFPDRFDATSGHLPLFMMVRLAKAFRAALDIQPGLLAWDVKMPWHVPTGSGETIVCLGLAYPGRVFVAEYNDNNPGTRYDARAPLAQVVANMFLTMHHACAATGTPEWATTP